MRNATVFWPEVTKSGTKSGAGKHHGERPRPEFSREPNGQFAWTGKTREPFDISKMDDQRVVKRAFLGFKNLGAGQGVERRGGKTIDGFRGQSDKLSRG